MIGSPFILIMRCTISLLRKISNVIEQDIYDLGWRRPAAAWSRVSVPSQWLRSGHGSESTESRPLDKWSVARPWLSGSAEKEFPQRRKVVKQVKYLLREKRSTVRVGRHTGRLKERAVPSQQFQSLIWGSSSVFPLSNHFALPGSGSTFGVSQDLPMCARASLSQDGFHRRGLWVSERLLASLPFWPPTSLSVHVQSRRSPDFKNEEYVASYLLSGQGPPPLSIVLLSIPVSEYRSTRNELKWFALRAHLSPASFILLW